MTALFFARHLGFIGGLALLAYILGRRVLFRLIFESAAERVATSTLFGLGVIGQATALAGMAGRFRPGVALGGAALIIVAGWPVWRSWRPRLQRHLFVLLPVAAVLCVLVGESLWPVWKFDGAGYHIPVAQALAKSGHLSVTPWLRFPMMPRHNEMLFAVALLFGNDVDAQLIESLFFALTALLLAGWAQRQSTRAAWWAAAAWLGAPLARFVATSAYVDVGLAAFVAATVTSLLAWRRSDARGWLLAAAVFAGFAASTKYHGLTFIGFGALLVAWESRRLGQAAIFVGIAVAVALPWYILDAVYTGDPFFPLAGRVFGYRYWTADDVISHASFWERHGVGRSFFGFLSLPWRMLTEGPRFAAEDATPMLALTFLPAVIYAAWRDAEVRILAALITAFTIFWLFTAQLARFWLPAAVLAGLCGALALDRVVPRLRRPWLATAITGAVVAMLLAPSLVSGWRDLYWRHKLPVSAADRDAYLTRQYPEYQPLRFLNRRFGSQYRVYMYPNLYAGRWLADGEAIGDDFGPARFAEAIPLWDRPAELHAMMTKLGCGFLLAPRDVIPHAQFADYFGVVLADTRSALYFRR